MSPALQTCSAWRACSRPFLAAPRKCAWRSSSTWWYVGVNCKDKGTVLNFLSHLVLQNKGKELMVADDDQNPKGPVKFVQVSLEENPRMRRCNHRPSTHL